MGKIRKARELGNDENKSLVNTILTYKEAEQMHRLKDYYVPYHPRFLIDSKGVNIYVDNGQQQITITYTIPEQNGMPAKKENIIIATGETNTRSAVKILQEYIKRLDDYQTLQYNNPQLCIAQLHRQGYTITPEGMNVFLTDGSDKNMNELPKEIERTIFTQNEKENIKPNEIEQNRQRHIDHREREVIASIRKYILDCYKDINVKDNSFLELLAKQQKQMNFSKDELESYIKRFSENLKKVEKYNKDRGNGNMNNDKDSLDYIFRNMKPIINTYGPNRDERGYIEILEDIIQTIPEDRRDKKQETYITPYFNKRKDLINIEQNEKAQKSKEEAQKYLEEKFIGTIDMNTQTKDNTGKEQLLKEAGKIDLNNITQFPNRADVSKGAR